MKVPRYVPVHRFPAAHAFASRGQASPEGRPDLMARAIDTQKGQ